MNKLIMTLHITTHEAQVVAGAHAKVVMLPFSATASGEFFIGETVVPGIDTQHGDVSGYRLSARYLLAGTDYTGTPCRLFIENNGSHETGYTPRIVTDSKALAFLEDATLTAQITCGNEGLVVTVFQVME